MKCILAQGLGQKSSSWDKTIDLLDDIETIVCPDLSILLSGNDANYKNLYSAFHDFCNTAGELVNICGLSIGGVLALNYAIEHPERVNSLVLIAAQYKMPKKMLMLQNAVFRLMPKSVFSQMGLAKKDFIELCRTMKELDFSSLLEKVSCPSLILCGDKDSANKKASIELASRIKNAEIRILDDCGHEINVELPQKLAVLLNDFYSRVC